MTAEQAQIAEVAADRPNRASRFLYDGFEIDSETDRLTCRYLLDDQPFRETVTVEGLGTAGDAGLEAARLVFLLAGVSYYKAGAPPVVDLGATKIREGEREFLSAYYTEGLGEFALRNGLELNLQVLGGVAAGATASFSPGSLNPLVPFGGGIDSIVTVEMLRSSGVDPCLFVVTSGRQIFAAIEQAAAISQLPVVKAQRDLDPEILRQAPGERFNGHVPITGIISSIAVLSAVLRGHEAVIMSNEWSASIGNVEVGEGSINHQYSKSLGFENSLRAVLRGAFEPAPQYFSLLRSASTLSIAKRFAALTDYHSVFRSCNRAFHVDPGARLPEWCGVCDKCCFVDLVLSPFLSADELSSIFAGREPLLNDDLTEQFETLLGLSGQDKPFECVGDVLECRAAFRLAANRPERQDNRMLLWLKRRMQDVDARLPGEDLMRPMGPNNVPDPYAAAADLG